MNISELDSYDLGDAVKFNDRLNPAIWDDNERMRPEVREQLLRIADDFREFLGINVEVKDITVSGSNAAYTYTPHSDIDLHLVVDLPRADANAVYRELFDAKKYAYNDMHDIRIGGSDVELYVQDANKTHHSQGIYSIQNDDWVSVPKRRKPDVDDISVRSKFEDLGHRIESAIATGDLVKITDMAEKLRDYRQAGLDAHGEFGPENLAFKILRTQGLIEKLYAARNRAKDELLSLDERKKKKRSVKYGYGAYWYPGTAYAGQDHPAGTEGGDGGGGDGGESLREGVPDTQQILQDFVKFAVEDLGIQQMPAIKLRRDPQWPVVNRTFGRYNNDAETLEVAWGQRHIMDVLRTVAHELTHKHQHERETVPDDAGETGSEFENEANARAGILMRDYAALHPEYFTAGQAQDLEEDQANKTSVLQNRLPTKLVISGYTFTLNPATRQVTVTHGGKPFKSYQYTGPKNYDAYAANAYHAISGTQPRDLAAIEKRDRGSPTAAQQSFEYPKSSGYGVAVRDQDLERAYSQHDQDTEGHGDVSGINDLGKWGAIQRQRRRLAQQQKDDEVKETAPIGFVVPGMSADPVTAWKRQVRDLILQYRQDPTRLGELAKEKGAGSAEAVAYAYMRNPTARIPLPPGAEVNEGASGYIPTRKQARDPRFSMALTVDIKPGQIGKEANKLKLKTDSQGRPQTARANGLFETLMAEYAQVKEGIQAPVAENKRQHLDFDSLYGKVFKITDNNGNSNNPGFSIVTPLNGASWNWKERPEFKKIVKQKLNDPGFLGDYKYQQIIDAMSGNKFDPAKHLAKEDEELDEVKMSPSALEKFATSDAAKGIRAGFEAELIFRDTQGSSDDIDPEPNYDADERAYSIAQVVEFFENDEYGYGLTDRERNRLEERLDEAYMQWRDEQITSDFRNDAEDLIRDVLLEETPMSERINVYLTDSMQRSDEEADRIIAAGVDAPKFNSSKDQAAYAAENPDYAAYLEAADAAETELDESVEYSVKEQDGYWDEALDDYRDDWSGDDDSFFSDIGLRWMSDVANEYGLDWPVWDMDNQRNEGSRSWEDIGNELAQVIDMPVVVSDNYHSTRRRPGQWILEPDGSLSPDDRDEEAGLEIVSPPMPLLTAIEKLKQVTDWANDPRGGNAYTNGTTGLHMGVSLPTMKSEDATDDIGIDYVKLILFMGDKYVLDQFGRTANTYTASALDKFRQNIKGKKSDPAGVVELLRHGLTELAYRELQKGVGTSKYTSAHIQNGYIEFRSPGGDWLAKSDEEIGILENTMLRFARAMAIAGDPSAERQEYAKKLYKLVTADNPEYADQLKLFSEFSAGTINKEQLKKQWAEKTIGKQEEINQRWKLYQLVNGTWTPVPAAEWNGYTEDQVKNAVWSKYGREALDSGEYKLVNMGEQAWEVYDVKTGKTLEIVKGKSKGEVADAVFDKYANQGIEFQVRPYEDPSKLTPRAKLAKRIVEPKKQPAPQEVQARAPNGVPYWNIVDRDTGNVVHTLADHDRMNAYRSGMTWLRGMGAESGYEDRFGVEPKMVPDPKARDARTDSADLQRTLGVQDVEPNIAQNFAPDISAYERNSDRIDAIRAQGQQPRQNYELVSDEDPDRVIHRMNNATADEVRAWIAQQEAGGMPTGFLRTRIVAESTGQNDDEQTQTALDMAAQDYQYKNWADVEMRGTEQAKTAIRRHAVTKLNLAQHKDFNMLGKSRSAIGKGMQKADQDHLIRQIQTARKLGDDVNENFADGKNPGRKGLSRRVGIPKKATLGQLEKIAKSSTGERRKMAQWQLNMRRGKAKKNK